MKGTLQKQASNIVNAHGRNNEFVYYIIWCKHKRRKLISEIWSNVNSLGSLEVEANSYGSLFVSIIMSRLTQQLKLIGSHNFSSDLWNHIELLGIMKMEVRSKCTRNCKYNSDRIGKNDNFMSKDILGFASPLYSQLKKRAKTWSVFAKKTISQTNVWT